MQVGGSETRVIIWPGTVVVVGWGKSSRVMPWEASDWAGQSPGGRPLRVAGVGELVLGTQIEKKRLRERKDRQSLVPPPKSSASGREGIALGHSFTCGGKKSATLKAYDGYA